MANSDFDPYQPPENDSALEAAVGRVVIAWGVLERQIDDAIQDIYRFDFDLAWSITANLGTKSKVEIFQSAAHCLAEFLEPVSMETSITSPISPR